MSDCCESKPSNGRYDLVVIGAGSAGFSAAITAADEGAHVALIVIGQWRHHYNTRRPHSALGYRPPAPETIVPLPQRPAMN